ELFRDLEDRDLPRRHRNRFTGAWVAGDAGLAVLHAEGAEATDLDVVAARERAGHRVQKRVHRLGDVLLRQTGALRNLVHDIGFGHLTPPAGPTGRPWKPQVEGRLATARKTCQSVFGQGVARFGPAGRAAGGSGNGAAAGFLDGMGRSTA